jgi:hypothetical protein
MAVTATLTGLEPGTTYYARIVATSAGGTIPGPIVSFTTPALPTGTTTGAAPDVTGTTATLSGSVNPAGSVTTVSFVYGTDPSLTTGTTTTAAQSIGNGTSPVTVTAVLTGLQPGTTYYFRLVVINLGGTTQTTILSFNTPASTPAVTLTSAQWQTVPIVKGKKTKKVPALVLHFSAPLSKPAAENLAAYALMAGKVKKRVTTYTKAMPLSSAVYNAGALTVTLYPKSTQKPATPTQLRITAAVLIDGLGRPLNNGHNAVVTMNKSQATITSQMVVARADQAALAIAPQRVSATPFVPHGPAGSWHRTFRG